VRTDRSVPPSLRIPIVSSLARLIVKATHSTSLCQRMVAKQVPIAAWEVRGAVYLCVDVVQLRKEERGNATHSRSHRNVRSASSCRNSDSSLSL
jgi:hypothetical protein